MVLANLAAATILGVAIFVIVAMPRGSDRPAASSLGPFLVEAICSPDPRATGFLTTNGNFNSTSGAPAMIDSSTGDISSATVYAYISQLNGTNDGGSSGEKSCGNPVYRYGGLLWLTNPTTATITWGAFNKNGNSGACYLVWGTNDYLHANWGTTCVWEAGSNPGINYRVLPISLTPGLSYQNDITLDTTGDFEFVWDSCSTFYEGSANTGKVVKTGVPKSDLDNIVSNTTAISWKPGANCGGALTQDGTGTSQSFVYDNSAPTITWATPSADAYNTTGTITPAWTVADPQSGVGNVGTVKRQYASLAGNSCGGTWTTEATQANNTATGVANARCYRWTFDPALATGAVKPTNNTGTAATTNFTSAIVKVDMSAPLISWTTPSVDAYITNGTITPAWTVADPETGVTNAGTVKRQYAALAANACGAWTTEATQTNGLATSLVAGRCYRWTYDPAIATGAVKPVNGAGTATSANLTSPIVKADPTAPTINWTTPSASAYNTTGTITPAWTVADPESGVANAGTVKRQYASLTGNACGGTWTTEATQANNTATALTTARCYRWTFDPALATGAVKPTNNAGTAATANLTSATIKVDTTTPAAPTVTSSAPAGSYRIGDTIYFVPSAGSTITLTSDGTDTDAGIASSTFGALSATTGWTYTAGTVAGDPANKNLTWAASAVSTSLAVTTTNNAGLTSASRTITFTADSTGPTFSASHFTAPTSEVSQTGSSYTFSWNAATDSGSGPKDYGYVRQSAPMVGGSCGGFSDLGSEVRQAGTSFEFAGMASGTCYRLAVRAYDNVGNISSYANSVPIKVGSVPTVVVSDDTAGNAATFRSGDTIYFGSSAAGSFTLTATGSDASSTIASNTFGVLAGAATGWSPTTAQTAAANPYSVAYAWTSGAIGTSTSVTSRNALGTDSAPVVITFTPDAAIPTLAFAAPAAGGPAPQTNTGFTVTFDANDAGSGFNGGAGWSVQRQIAPAADGACGTFVDDTAAGSLVTGSSSGSGQTSGQTLVTGNCYRWILNATDAVSNAASAVTSGSVLVDALAPAAPAITDDAPAGSYRSGNTVYYRPSVAGSITLTSTGEAPSGITGSTFGTLSNATGWTYSSGIVAGNPADKEIAWSTTAAATTLPVTTTNGMGLTSPSTTITFTPDSTVPLINNLLPAGGTSSQTSNSVTIAWNETENGAGVASRVLQRQSFTTTGGAVSCVNGVYADEQVLPDQPSPVIDSGLSGNTCYRWTVTVTDRVGNTSTTATSGMVFVVDNSPSVTDNLVYATIECTDTTGGGCNTPGVWPPPATGPATVYQWTSTIDSCPANGRRVDARIYLDTVVGIQDHGGVGNGNFVPTVQGSFATASSGINNDGQVWGQMHNPDSGYQQTSFGCHLTIRIAWGWSGTSWPRPAAWRSGDSVWFNPASGGSFNLTATGAAQFGTITSNTFGALSGTPTGWSPAGVQTSGNNPYTVGYAWTAGAASTSTAVTSRNNLGNDSSAKVIRFRADTTPPTVAFLNPASNSFPIRVGTSYTVHFSAGDTGSGFLPYGSGWRLRRQVAPVTNGLCGAFSNDNTASLAGLNGFAADRTAGADISRGQALTSGSCYRWQLAATDSVGNTSATVTSGAVLVNVDPASAQLLVPAVQPTTSVGAETWIVVTTQNTAGQPISNHHGTATVRTDDPTAIFPDGASYTFTGKPDETGANIRVLFGTPGAHAVSLSNNTGTVSGSPQTVTAGATELTAEAPATAYQGVPFALRVRPTDTADNLTTAYAARVTFSSTDPTATYGSEVNGSNQYTFSCACDDGHQFSTALSTLGLQTVTVTDQFGNVGQATVDVVPAPSTIANPFEIRAVQWNHGSVADFYIDPGAYEGEYSVLGIESLCTGSNEVLGVTGVRGPFQGRSQFSSANIDDPDCYLLNNWSARNHILLLADDAGHEWAVSPTSSGATQGQADNGVYYRFSYVPDNSRWLMIDPGHPVAAMSNTFRLSGVSQASSPANPDKITKWVPFGAGFAATMNEDAYVFSVSYRTGIITDFDKGISPIRQEPVHSGQFFPLNAGASAFAADDISYACWFGPRGVTSVRFTVFNASGRRGLQDVALGAAGNDGQAWCDDPMGPSWPPAEQPAYHDMFDGFREWVETDPVDPYGGGYLHDVTDFTLGGLAPSLALTRHYDSQVAEAQAAGTATRSTIFGRGWSSSLDWYLADGGTNAGKIVDADGHNLEFAFENGEYSPASGSQYALTAIAGGYKLTDQSGAGRRFDTSGRQVAIFDPQGREMTMAYTAGKLSSITDAVNRTAQVTTNATGLVTRVDLPDGRYVAFTYDASGFMSTSRTLDGQVLTFVSDVRGRITAIKDGADTLLTNTYDGKGRVFRQIDALGNPSFLVYNTRTDSQVTRVISPRAGVTTDCFGVYGSSLVGRVDPEGGLRRWTYDHRGNPQTATDELGNTVHYTFDANSRPIEVIDELGRTLSIAYDATGKLSSMTDSTGASVDVSFDPVTGLPTSVSQSKGTNSFVTATYVYDPATSLPRFIGGPAGSGTAELQYDSRGYVSASVDAEGRTTTFVTDVRGFVTEIVGPLGNVAGGNPAQHRTTYTYDDMGRVLTATNPLSEATTYTYDAFGRLETVVSPLGHLTTYVYDDLGRLTSATSELTATVDATTSYEYDDDGNLVAVVDAENRRTESGYDLAGRVIEIIDADGKHWTNAYDAAGQLISTTDPTGRTSSTTYDNAGRVVATTDPAGQDTTYTYTEADQVETITDPLQHVTTFGYDWRGFQTSVLNAKDEETTATYDNAGNLLTVTDGRLKATTFEYDLTGLLTRVIEHGGTIETAFDYDDAGRLLVRTNDRGGAETYEYDRLDRVTKLTDAVTNERRTFYDADGRVDYTIDGKGQTTDFVYDKAGRLLTVTPAAGSAISYVYDKTGRLGSMTDGNGTTAYGYDPLGRLTSFTRGGRTTGYGYDSAGRPTSVTYPGAQGTVGYGYDAAGRLDTISDWLDRLTTYTYDDASRVTGIARPGDLSTTITYDELDRPVSVSHERNSSLLLALGYTYDAAGNLATYADDLGTATFGYDNLNRLTSAAYPSGQDYAYTYDAVGNILTATTPVGTASYTYDLADRITSDGPGGSQPGSATRAPSSDDAGWTASAGAYASDDTYATAAPPKNQTVTLDLGTFGFDAQIPAGSTIDLVTVSVEWKVDTAASNATLGSQVYVGGVARGTELVNASEPTSDTVATYTVTGLTRADLLDGVLEVRVRISRGNSNNAVIASLDSVSVTVDYTVPGSPAVAPTYDGNGAMTSDGSYGNRTFTYDPLGRLTGVTGPGVTATYNLDGAGNRWAETLDGVTTAFDLDLASPFPTILADGTRTYLPGAPSAGYDEAGVWFSGLTDQHGSILGTVSQTGVLSALRTYDPYGAPRPGSADPTGVGFTGEWRNGTGLVHLRSRDYDPVLARFISRDTFAGLAMAPQTANRYAFGAGNPLTAADPSGHFNNHLIMPVRAFVSLGVSALGPLGLGYVTLTGILGYDPIAGVALSPEERLLSVAPVAVVGVIATIGPKLARLAPRLVSATLGRADGALAAGRAGLTSRIGRAGESLSAFGSRVGRAADRARDVISGALRGRPVLGNQFGHVRLGRASAPAGQISLTPYASGLGHHVLAKSAFRGAGTYDMQQALAISNAELGRLGISHARISGAQQTLYRQFAASGDSLTWQAIGSIERKALVAGGASPGAAARAVEEAIADLQRAGVLGPTRIPWAGG